MFLGVTAVFSDYKFEAQKREKNLSFNLTITDNPLLTYVELPADLKAL